MDTFFLSSAFDLMTNFDPLTCYTRSDAKTNSFTLIDGILISTSLVSRVRDVMDQFSLSSAFDLMPNFDPLTVLRAIQGQMLRLIPLL